MTTLRPNAERKTTTAGEGLPRMSPGPCGAASRGGTDAALLVGRVGRELARLATMADEIQRTIGEQVGAMALADPALMRQAQTLDLLTQSLRGLSSFLAGLEHHRIGHEALDFDAAAASLELGQLGDRLAGRSSVAAADDVEFF